MKRSKAGMKEKEIPTSYHYIIIIIIIIIYLNFHPPPRRGSRVQSDNTNIIINIDPLAHILYI